MDYCYSFPAVKGKQANSFYYICMIPCGLLSKLFMLDNNDIDPEFRAQRKVNFSRINEISNYITKNRNNYVFSALAASIDGEYTFEVIDNDLGILKISMNSKFLINDGQHRNAAIQSAIEEDSTLSDETIPVVFFEDKGLQHSKQMFTDLNKHAVNTSKSLNTLYDSNDALAVETRALVNSISFLKMYTEVEKDNLGKYSAKLFTLNNFYNANQKLTQNFELNNEIIDFMSFYWNLVVSSITEWKELTEKDITKKSLREEYIITQGVVLLALGKLGNFMYKEKIGRNEMKEYSTYLSKINWLRTNPIWEGRALVNGKIIRKESYINLIYIKIKDLIGIHLSEKEYELDRNVGVK